MSCENLSTMYSPDITSFRTLSAIGNLIPVTREILADKLTPVSAYERLVASGDVRYSFLLESVEGGERVGRYSILGRNPSKVLRSRGLRATIDCNGAVEQVAIPEGEDPLLLIKNMMMQYNYVSRPGLPRFCGGAVGFFSYDVVRFFEDLPDTNEDPLQADDACFFFTDTLVIFDHVRHKLILLCNALVDGNPDIAYQHAVDKLQALEKSLKTVPSEVRNAPTLQQTAKVQVEHLSRRDQYEAAVERCKEYIAAGDAFQIVLSQRFKVAFSAPPFDIYRALRSVNPSPYMFFLDLGNRKLIGSSPEILVTVTSGTVRLRPIAGSAPRGETPEDDERNERELLTNEKERAEHIMLVDLGRNDVGRVSHFGTVKVNELMVVEKYSHIMHIVSDVTGRLAEGRDMYDVLRASFPAGTVSGAPKVRAMQIIEEQETLRRGFYAGAIGYFGFNGDMDMAITIRTMLVDGQVAYLQSGGGLVADSVPAKEYQECMNKAGALIAAIQRAEEGLD